VSADLLLQDNPPPASISLPRPKGALTAQGETLYLPGLACPLLRDIDVAVQPGETHGIIGPAPANPEIDPERRRVQARTSRSGRSFCTI
jgi:ABC-type protease/lipase transport system fused ATPase/permease subunit